LLGQTNEISGSRFKITNGSGPWNIADPIIGMLHFIYKGLLTFINNININFKQLFVLL